MNKKNYSNILSLETTFKKNIISTLNDIKCVVDVKNASISKNRVSIFSDIDLIIIVKNNSTKSDIIELKDILAFFFKKYSSLFAHQLIIIPEILLLEFYKTKLFDNSFSEKFITNIDESYIDSSTCQFNFFLSKFERSVTGFFQLRTYLNSGIEFDKNKFYKRVLEHKMTLSDWKYRKTINPSYGSFDYIKSIKNKHKNITKKVSLNDLISLGVEINKSSIIINNKLNLINNKNLTILKSNNHGKSIFAPQSIIDINNIINSNKFIFNKYVIEYFSSYQTIDNNSHTKTSSTYYNNFTNRKKFFSSWERFIIKHDLSSYCSPLSWYFSKYWKTIISI